MLCQNGNIGAAEIVTFGEFLLLVYLEIERGPDDRLDGAADGSGEALLDGRRVTGRFDLASLRDFNCRKNSYPKGEGLPFSLPMVKSALSSKPPKETASRISAVSRACNSLPSLRLPVLVAADRQFGVVPGDGPESQCVLHLRFTRENVETDSLNPRGGAVLRETIPRRGP